MKAELKALKADDRFTEFDWDTNKVALNAKIDAYNPLSITSVGMLLIQYYFTHCFPFNGNWFQHDPSLDLLAILN